MTQELEAARPPDRDTLMTTELVPEQILPKVMSTFGLTAAYVFIICWVTGSSVMAGGGWTAIPMWVLGILTFLIPAGMAVVELGNLWPGQGGVYIWAYRTMGETWGFIGGYLSWVPVILNAASSPAVVLQFLLLAFHTELGLTTSIILQLVILWTVIGLALAKLAANQKIMNVVFVVYGVLTLTIFICGSPSRTVRPHRSAGRRRRSPTSPSRASCTAPCCCTCSVWRPRTTWARSSSRCAGAGRG